MQKKEDTVSKYHYTYLIQHKYKNKRYIGVRTSKVEPIKDNKYWGSSKHLPENIKDTHNKIILKIFKTREEAVNHEIILHELNNVVADEAYYNRSKQKTRSFDTQGLTFYHTEDARRKISEAKKGCKNPFYGKKHTEETRKKMSASGRGRKQTSEHIAKRIQKGANCYNAKVATVYNYETHEIIIDNVCISEWIREHNFNKSAMLRTAKADLNKKHDSIKNKHHYKNMYVRYKSA